MSEESILLEHFYHIKLVYVNRELFPSSWEKIPHSHEQCELFIHLQGEIDIYAEKNMYHLSGGEIRIYSAGELHCGTIARQQHMEWYQISIPPEFRACPEAEKLMELFVNREYGVGNVFLSRHQERIAELISEAFDWYRKEKPLWECYCASAVLQILCLLNNAGDRVERMLQSNAAFQKILGVIHSNYQSLETIQDICELTHYSASYINRLFRENINISAYQFLLGKKLDEAKKALRTGRRVTEACETAGFGSYSNFITLFRKKLGITPKKFEQQVRGAGEPEESSEV
ncbi:MAG: AraC family transcriptional regulator [Lachnospiraceae bacterium]|nr:AraC family transcriptional regulator [Lachnospiraceae bacterium]